jgi:hypothetical protein
MSHLSDQYDPMFTRLVDDDGAVMVKVYELSIEQKPDNFADRSMKIIIDYIYVVISILWQTILIVHQTSALAIEDINKSITDVKSQIANAKPSQQKTAQHNVKCSRCHARGHQQSKCQTENPAAVRRRVANNNKARIQRRANLASFVPPITSSAAMTHYADPLANPLYANVLADAHEYHRRKQQSNRDRRKAKT